MTRASIGDFEYRENPIWRTLLETGLPFAMGVSPWLIVVSSVCALLTNKSDGPGSASEIKDLEILAAHFHPYVTGLVSKEKRNRVA
ncbi:hypothetical protein [Agrobacterium rubi]|uniref:hypothetical protein n=1 Tax=Agrobacterium rubi TaxID=28099 RepID=UPI00103A9EB7|nr:hypothetical protein [Agrobacterium rubi]MBP1879093.1 hypothetical protein [Agrobacterium rubi]